VSEKEKAPHAFQAYWLAYGGYKVLFRSPYLWLSFGLTCFIVPAWDTRADGNQIWVGLALQIIPSIVSFSLGAMAIILSVASGKFLSVIQQSGRTDSFFMKMIAAFFHFILVQFIALFAAIFGTLYTHLALSFVGCFLFVYSLACGIAAAAALVNVAMIRNKAPER
jgi:hypothetical protein